jgi:hypothetical protein
MTEIWLVYTLADSRAPDEIRYVGITSNPTKRLGTHKRKALNGDRSHRATWIRALLRDGAETVMTILSKNLDFAGAKTKEIETIAAYRAAGFRLTNGTDGGDGTSGWQPTAEQRERNAAARRGKKLPVEVRDKMSIAQRNRIRPPDATAKANEARRGTKHTTESREKMSLALRGRSLSEETRQKIGIGGRGKKRGITTRERIARARRLASPTSGNYKGVGKARNGWVARLTIDDKRHRLGTFKSPEAAACAYDDAAFQSWGFDCYLNCPDRLMPLAAAVR